MTADDAGAGAHGHVDHGADRTGNGDGSTRGDDPPIGKRAEQAAATKAALVRAARAVFSRDGYQGATIAAITDRADTAHGTFYLYFKNKEDVFGAVFVDTVDVGIEFADEFLEGPVTRERLLRHADRQLSNLHEERGLFRAMVEALVLSPRMAQAWYRMRQDYTDALEKVLVAKVDAGELILGSPATVAAAVSSTAEWFGLANVVLPPEPLDDHRRSELADVLAEMYVALLLPGSGP